MDISALYETAKNFAEIIRQKNPSYADDPDACLALIVANTGDMYSGITSLSINEGSPEIVSADTIAAMSLVLSGAKAKQLIIVTLDEDHACFDANEKALRILIKAAPENGTCEVVLSPEEAAPAASLLPNANEEFLSGFDDVDAPEEAASAEAAPAAANTPLGAPADFASGFDVDDSNPFAASNGGQGGEIKSFYDQPADAQQQGASGFNNPYAQQQGMPQQGGFPQ